MRTVNVPGVKLVPEKYQINGFTINAVTCVRERRSMPFYHFTHLRHLEPILKSKMLVAKSEGKYGIVSGSVSFSINPQHTYGAGNIKLTFTPVLGKILVPMRYYDYNAERKRGFKYGKLEDKYRQKYGINEMSTVLGAIDDIYINECEWFSRSDINVTPYLESVTFMIPWSAENFGQTSCKNVSPESSRHVRIETYTCDFECLQQKIQAVGNIVRKYGCTFFVDSCFPYIKDNLYQGGPGDEWKPYIVLNSQNLQRLAQGRKVVRSDSKDPELVKACKC